MSSAPTNPGGSLYKAQFNEDDTVRDHDEASDALSSPGAPPTGPTFKDQMRNGPDVIHEPRSAVATPLDHDDSSSALTRTPPNGFMFPFRPAVADGEIPFADAQAVQVPELQLRQEEIEDLQHELMARKRKQRRVFLCTFVVGLLCLVAVLAGVCGSGNCKNNRSRNVVGFPTPTFAPTRNSPTLPPIVVLQRAQNITLLIRRVSLSSSELRYPINETDAEPSPEELALSWLIDQDGLQIDASLADRVIQRYAIAVLFYGLGPGTLQNTRTASDWLSDVDECNWKNVTCENGTLINLIPEEQGLQGSVPSDVGLLTATQALSLSLNKVQGELPTTIGLLTDMILLGAFGNQISGTFPTELALLTNMEYLDLHDNEFIDSFPSFISGLTNLKSLNLGENFLSFTIPDLSGLTQLSFLSLNSNLLTGTIPPNLARSTKLELLNLFDNR